MKKLKIPGSLIISQIPGGLVSMRLFYRVNNNRPKLYSVHMFRDTPDPGSCRIFKVFGVSVIRQDPG